MECKYRVTENGNHQVQIPQNCTWIQCLSICTLQGSVVVEYILIHTTLLTDYNFEMNNWVRVIRLLALVKPDTSVSSHRQD